MKAKALKNKKRTRKGKNLLILCSAAVILLFLLILFSAGTAAANAEEYGSSEKYYTSITVESGDTLWSIAEEYMTDEYKNINVYIDEVIRINHLHGDMIRAGQDLCIPYYSAEQK